MQQTLKVAYISQFSTIEGEYPSELSKTYDVCLVKSIKGSFQRGSFNDKHVNFSLLKDFYPFLEFKKDLVVGPEKKRKAVCKNAPIIALVDF